MIRFLAIFGPFWAHNRSSGGSGWLSLYSLIVSAASMGHFGAENLKFLAFLHGILRHFFGGILTEALLGALRKPQEAPGRPQEAFRRPQKPLGGLRRLQGGLRRPPEGPRSSQEGLGGPREASGGLQKGAGAPRRIQGPPEMARNQRRTNRKKINVFCQPLKN